MSLFSKRIDLQKLLAFTILQPLVKGVSGLWMRGFSL